MRYYKLYFNPRSREGSDNFKIAISKVAADFNPHSREGSDKYGKGVPVSAIDFNPRSREGSDLLPSHQIINRNSISIHAPARGATYCLFIFVIIRYISIHAPARGATKIINSLRHTSKFQSTLPRGERQRAAAPKLCRQ